jgi:hypothetical protein
VDGIRLDVFVPGCSYEIGNSLGALFLAEGWAEPVDTQDAAAPALAPLTILGNARSSAYA